MLVKVRDLELYAEAEPGETEGETYDKLKKEILNQAMEQGVNVKFLKFWYD